MSEFRQSSLPEHNGTLGAQSLIARNRVLRNTYWLLALSMIPTVLGALLGLSSGINRVMGASPGLSAIVFLVGAFGLMFLVEKNKNSSLGVALLMAFTFFMGIMLSRLLGFVLGMGNGAQLIMLAFGGTAAVFATMATVASTTKRDFSGMQKFLFVGAVILLVAALANIFLQLPALMLTISVMAIGIFSAFLLVDLQRVINGGETNYVSATLAIYLDVYNIFSNLLMLLGILGGNRE
ncbi:Bax inhibitor-1/YccA family protein [Alcaligenes ammonioxydans]|jgi:modulator of FtsH protease|uniref:Bax inhibitor-1/YccA family protein n=1 Tax=Alcaligenes ammonioxydans TaxID=2582914 RepID=A0ABX8SWD8_9BURK|nr:Bax inhibitor-1/YccA family protein [Alcaligenes ammonioxydans]EJC64877.1 inner membrane protein YccA [Alcaligenes faecalis subsp. faecalis NCIB 8687]WGQ34610.1 Bax inhibitor-1/YccA family protein [Alcaligenes faecalis]MCH1880851.1 Bax inhibitor-1/YccA family protein [Alcaligenes ammonioxydans]QXX79670.1 Bax inhibitor-1/YccA family protein [Alcaligenes ammonioxydans]HRK84964.1 Bax inhibitor-1/YccA family protein [Alcaligenes faecalis]